MKLEGQRRAIILNKLNPAIRCLVGAAAVEDELSRPSVSIGKLRKEPFRTAGRAVFIRWRRCGSEHLTAFVVSQAQTHYRHSCGAGGANPQDSLNRKSSVRENIVEQLRDLTVPGNSQCCRSGRRAVQTC